LVVAAKAPDAVVCLISTLAFHGITTQVPRAVHLAVPRGRYAGLRLRTPPVKIYRFDVPTFDQGIEAHPIDGVPVCIYGVARTLVDCFKYRNKLGLDVAIEAPCPQTNQQSGSHPFRTSAPSPYLESVT
jgi:predicted transcriptional regulator of viral defense system